MPGPSLSVRPVKPKLIQSPAGVIFEVIHNPLGKSIRLDHNVNMIRPNMSSQQNPLPLRTAFL